MVWTYCGVEVVVEAASSIKLNFGASSVDGMLVILSARYSGVA